MFRKTELEHWPVCRPEVVAHCRRVAALCQEIASRLTVPERLRTALEQAAGLHHVPAVVLKPAAFERLLQDLFPSGPPKSRGPKKRLWFHSSDPGESALRQFHGIRAPSNQDQIKLLVEILRLSDWVDQELVASTSAPLSATDVWSGLETLRGLIQPAVLEAAYQALRAPFRIPQAHAWEFPVQARVAQEVLCALADKPECDVMSLARLAGRDPVIAGKLILTANSALYGRVAPVQSILQAISYIGTEATRKVVLALAVQRLMGSAGLQNLWRHSVWMAQYCEALASQTGVLPADQGLLVGLVHDIGRIAIATLPREACESETRLVERGCPPCLAEPLLFDRDHAEIGAEILRGWRFPDALVEAVRLHHRPADSDSPAASLLYLAEFWSETDEDLPSARHLETALAKTGSSLETLAWVQHMDHSLQHMLTVA